MGRSIGIRRTSAARPAHAATQGVAPEMRTCPARMPAAAQQLSAVYPIGSRLADDGRLELGGFAALDLAREFGTPVIVVSGDDSRGRGGAFKQAFAARAAACEGP